MTTIAEIDGWTLLAQFPPRLRDSHKGSHGHVLVIGGAAGMRGAAVLAAQAALWSGAGRVSLACPDAGGPGLIAGLPELLCPALPEALEAAREAVVVLGPGLGTALARHALFDQLAEAAACLVLDADALTLLASRRDDPPRWRPGQLRLMTPHPGEAARLLGCSSAEVQADRVGSARLLATHWQAHVVLKGAGSLVLEPDGSCLVNPTGNAGLAAAGMGDVLSGMIAALLAQRLAPAHALALGVWLHGAAADLLVSEGVGPRGITASEIGLAARRLLNRVAPPTGVRTDPGRGL
jgi:hydroxyethylthiazole kinase-like uncharacterized protein yjeF